MTENLLNNIIASAEEQFGKGCIDASDDIYFIIKVPDTIITNEKGTKYINKGIYVKVNKGNALFLIGKAHYTLSEISIGFIHPHVNPFNHTNLFSAPCLGQGPLRSLIAEIEAEKDEETLISLWDIYMMQLKVFLESESIAGTPYIRLDKVINHSIQKGHSGFISRKMRVCTPLHLILLQNVVRRAIIEDKIPIVANEVGSKYNVIGYTEVGAISPYHLSDYIKSRHIIILTDILYRELTELCTKYSYDREIILEELSAGGIIEEYIVDKYNILMKPNYSTQAVCNTIKERIEGKFLTSFNGEDIKVQVEELSNDLYLYAISYACLYYIVNRINVEIHNTVKRDGETFFIS